MSLDEAIDRIAKPSNVAGRITPDNFSSIIADVDSLNAFVGFPIFTNLRDENGKPKGYSMPVFVFQEFGNHASVRVVGHSSSRSEMMVVERFVGKHGYLKAACGALEEIIHWAMPSVERTDGNA